MTPLGSLFQSDTILLLRKLSQVVLRELKRIQRKHIDEVRQNQHAFACLSFRV